MKEEKQIQLAFTNKEDEEYVLKFKSIYEHKHLLIGAKKEILKDKFKDDIKLCRFCSKSETEVSFKQVTHVIPQLLKKAKPISNFECDECNAKFSKFETDFSNYYLLHRAMFGHTKKSGGIAKLKTKDGVEIQGVRKTKENLKQFNLSEEEAEQFLNSNHKLVRLLADEEDEGINVSDNGDIISIEVVRPTYKPLNVYRTFLKIALSMIPQDEYQHYKSMLNILNNDYEDMQPELFCFLQHILPKYNSYFSIPMVAHWNRSEDDEKQPQKVFALYMDNKILQIPIFSDNDFDRIFVKGEKYTIPTVPAILNPIVLINNDQDFEFHKELSSLKFQHIDFSGIDKVKGEKDQITITKDFNIRVETKNISIIESEEIEEFLEEQLWGFNLFPEFIEYNKVDLKIIFILKIPIDNTKYVHIKSGSFYQIENSNKKDIVKDLGFIADLLAASMEHTYKMFLQKFPQYDKIEVRSFSKIHFHSHIEDQLKEKGLLE